MGLKILHTADWHLDSPFTGFSQAQREVLKQRQREIPRKVAEACRRENCQMMLLAGDVFDGVPNRDTVDSLKAVLGSIAVPVFIAPGNHDFIGPDSPWLEVWPENVHIFAGPISSVSLPELDCRVYGAGYESMDCGPLLARFQREGDERYHIGVLHGDPVQKNSPYCPITNAQVRSSGLDCLALGHIHKAGFFRAGQTLCVWPGCPMGRGWDEAGEKGVCVLTLEEEAQVQAVPLDTLRFHNLQADVEGGAEEALEKLLPGAGSQDFYRITLTGYGSVDPAALRRRFPEFPNLELRDETRPPLDIWAGAGADTLEGVYFRLLQEELEASPDNREIIQRAAEISRRLLDGREVQL